MSKAKPHFIFSLWCWGAGWACSASDADWNRRHGIGNVRARVIVGAAELGMWLLSPLWWWGR